MKQTASIEFEQDKKFSRIHCYAAGFGGELASHLILRFTEEGDTVLDPFAGSGTTLLQARAARRRSVGIDIDPVACLIARVGTRGYGESEIGAIERYVAATIGHLKTAYTKDRFDISAAVAGGTISVNGIRTTLPNADGVNYWFSPSQRFVLAGLTALAQQQQNPEWRELLLAAISSAIIRKWPATLSLAMDIDHSRPHRVGRRGITVRSQFERFEFTFRRFLGALRETSNLIDNRPFRPKIIEADVVDGLQRLATSSIDLILTSPPYINAIDYPRAHKFSEWWIWPNASKCVPANYLGLRRGGSDTHSSQQYREILSLMSRSLRWIEQASPQTYSALRRYVTDMDQVLRESYRVLRNGSYIVYVVANNVVAGRTVPVVSILTKLMKRNRFRMTEILKRPINSRRRRYPYGISGFQGLMEHEYVLIARK